MNRDQLAAVLADELDITQALAKRALVALFDPRDGIIAEQLSAGESVSITGFGKFEARERAARTARNPATGEDVQVPARLAPAFKAGSTLKKTLND